MKTSIIIFFFLLQAFLISTSAMNDSPIPIDSSSIGKSLIVLNDGNDYYGEIISRTNDSLNIKYGNNTFKMISTKLVSCIINLKDDYNPNLDNKFANNYMFTMPDEKMRYGQIYSFDGIDYHVKLEDNTITTIDSYNFSSYNFPAYSIKSIEWINGSGNHYSRVFLENTGVLDCQIISMSWEIIKLIVQSKYLVIIPKDFFSNKVDLIKISDTTKSTSQAPHLIVLKNNKKISGKILSKTKDSLIIKVDPGLAVKISSREINNIYPYNHYAKNVFYIDAGTIIFAGYVNANYEYMLSPYISLRVGAGIGYSLNFSSSSHSYQGVTGMLNFLPGSNNSKFELGFGLSYFKEKNENYYYSQLIEKTQIAFSIGYRYQNKYEGMLFRTGICFLGYGGGLYLSLGYAF